MRVLLGLLIILTISLNHVNAQNLVKNYSFEDTIPCAVYTGIDPELRPYYWYRANGGSPDFFNTVQNCSFGGGVPGNAFGYQYPRTGNAFVGIELIAHPPYVNDREYIEGVLIDTLIQNHFYCIQFYVSASNNCKYLTDDIGIFFSLDTLINYANSLVFPVTPQIVNTQGSILQDTLSWSLVSGNFIASGGEKFITIGNFFSDQNTTVDTLQGASISVSYYYIDDVSVVDGSVGISEIPELNFSIQPNPVKDQLFVTSENYNSLPAVISISNIEGQVLLKKNYIESVKSKEIDVSDFPSGIYFISFQTKEGKWVRKFVKN